MGAASKPPRGDLGLCSRRMSKAFHCVVGGWQRHLTSCDSRSVRTCFWLCASPWTLRKAAHPKVTSKPINMACFSLSRTSFLPYPHTHTHTHTSVFTSKPNNFQNGQTIHPKARPRRLRFLHHPAQCQPQASSRRLRLLLRHAQRQPQASSGRLRFLLRHAIPLSVSPLQQTFSHRQSVCPNFN